MNQLTTPTSSLPSSLTTNINKVPSPDDVLTTFTNCPCYIVDAFVMTNSDDNTIKKYDSGNPAAVVLMSDDSSNNYNDSFDEDTKTLMMQLIAKEFNLSETAFVCKMQNDDNDNDDIDIHYNIRYFTPTSEVPLCGHATLASSSILFQYYHPNKNNSRIVFHTIHPNVILTTTLNENSHDKKKQEQKTMVEHSNDIVTSINMTFPIAPVVYIIDDDEIAAIRYMVYDAFFSTMMPSLPLEYIRCIGYVPTLGDLFIELSYEAYIKLPYNDDNIDYNVMKTLQLSTQRGAKYSRGIIITCKAPPKHNNNLLSEEDLLKSLLPEYHNHIDPTVTDDVHFYSRFFAPTSGINEDPVTGSAHCALAPYYYNMMNGYHKEDLMNNTLIGYQTSKRGGIVSCQISDDEQNVHITGATHVFMSGTIKW